MPPVTVDLVCPVQNYDTPIMPDHRRALCPVRRGVITGIRPYARYQGLAGKSNVRRGRGRASVPKYQ